ncbi:MAG TPA: SufD family Fe-S cluster assembly protein [Sphingobium sp.]|uniref:SufD family Fe-S cluster assembly protein n=1 Tax=Sphingobium sp. TaxID=1912891 RepID=UPI002ECFD0DD
MTALTTHPLPTRKAEDWRYSDVDALAQIWPVAAPERIDVAAGEKATRTILQDAGDDAVIVRDHVVSVGEGGRFGVHLLNIGGRLGRVTFDVTLARGAHFELSAAIIGGGEQTLEVVTTVTHAEPAGTSQQTVRSVLAGHATGNYLGRIAVARDAQKTDAAQSVKAMLLDRTATANAKPELEIFADDVKCAHGATVGELDKTALFYCAARGIDPATARTLLLQAFIAGLFDDMTDAAERERFEAAALAKMASLSGVEVIA